MKNFLVFNTISLVRYGVFETDTAEEAVALFMRDQGEDRPSSDDVMAVALSEGWSPK